MATNMCRRLGRGLFYHSLSRGRHTRLVCSLPRVIFASNKHLQSTFPGSNSFEKMRPALVGVRMFADAGTALTRDEIQTRAMDVLKLFDKVNPEKVSSKSHFVNDLGLDSLDVVEIVMALEDEFGIEISDEEAEKVFTVEDAVEFISKALDIH
ncbi:acyl carrier protein [Pocillopora verrucosa]|uniref:acyl carrier protein n=1 Tax=Pocillopora verrucosa TaxID=203993 RepID=UPI00334119EE